MLSYLVKVGWVHLIRHQNDGSALVLQKTGPGSVVAEASADSRTYHCDAAASGPQNANGVRKRLGVHGSSAVLGRRLSRAIHARASAWVLKPRSV